MDDSRLDNALQAGFDCTPADRRVVVRQATDLADSGKSEIDRDVELTVEEIVANLEDAPEESDLVDCWNWWLGALDIAYGGYARFLIFRRESDSGGVFDPGRR